MSKREQQKPKAWQTPELVDLDSTVKNTEAGLGFIDDGAAPTGPFNSS